jgi:hypothetical protein
MSRVKEIRGTEDVGGNTTLKLKVMMGDSLYICIAQEFVTDVR